MREKLLLTLFSIDITGILKWFNFSWIVLLFFPLLTILQEQFNNIYCAERCQLGLKHWSQKKRRSACEEPFKESGFKRKHISLKKERFHCSIQAAEN